MIEVSGLVKRFKNITAVKGIDFHVKKGEVFGFLGPNGAGKTTTIKMLCTIMKQDAGKVTVNGFDTLKESSKVRKSIGIIFQEPSLDNDLSVYENLYFHSRLFHIQKNLIKKKIDNSLKLVGLFDRKKDHARYFSGEINAALKLQEGSFIRPKCFF